MYKTKIIFFSLAMTSAFSSAYAAEATNSNAALGEIVVEGENTISTSVDTPYTSPSTSITQEQVESINATTVEDFVKYEPSIVVRRRYIGDPNGVVGIRGSGMFQTARALIFADGVPLHNLLQTRWNGAPRWSLASNDETESVEVIYGPFSAEYAGNAMGGVVNINTKLPDKYEFNAELGIFAQDYNYMGTNDTFIGHREFVSVGDRFDKVSLYLSHNHMDNDSQPMTLRSGSTSTPAGGETAVTGGHKATNSTGSAHMYYMDTGPSNSVTDLTKMKIGYEMGDWLARFTIAYENRTNETAAPNNYLRDGSNNPFWSGSAVQDGSAFSVTRSRFAVSESDRETLLLAANLEGTVGKGWTLETGVSTFDVLKDQSLSSDENPADPTFDSSGTVGEFDDTGWMTFDVKARTDNFMNRKDMNFVTGVHYDHYKMLYNSYTSNNYASAEKTSIKSTVGGETQSMAAFAQWGWQFSPDWDVTIGGRYERWTTMNGKNYNYSTKNLDIATRSETGFSPKLSLGYKVSKGWTSRYSIAKAYRFPIVEELYHNEAKTNGTTIANEKLKPEDGLHQNLMFEKQLDKGFMRFNIFHESVEDVIYSQTDYTATPTVSTFLPIDEVVTKGVEYILQREGMLGGNTDVRFNLTWLDSKITKNDADTSAVGKKMPRLPEWRANLLLTQRINPDWKASAGVRYASNSFGRLDNTDTASNVYGSIDSYTFVDVKAMYKINKNGKITFGIDNLNNEIAFVAHPWPQRTYYIQGSLHF